MTFPTADHGVVSADLYGSGSRAIVLVPGGRFDKSSWESEARVLAEEGFLVLAISLRGRGESREGTAGSEALHLDVLGAVQHLHTRGASRSAHAQLLFQTEQGEQVLREILRFLTAPH